jgi:hypothetical protein
MAGQYFRGAGGRNDLMGKGSTCTLQINNTRYMAAPLYPQSQKPIFLSPSFCGTSTSEVWWAEAGMESSIVFALTLGFKDKLGGRQIVLQRPYLNTSNTKSRTREHTLKRASNFKRLRFLKSEQLVTVPGFWTLA